MRLDSLLPDQRKAPRQSPTRRLRPAVFTLVFLFAAYEFAHMWREPEMRKMRPQLAIVAGVVIFIAAFAIASVLLRSWRSPKHDDKQSTLKL
ncbi:MAG TPA: hypothetical protein VGR81_00410 [Candidatus Acidoferrales bacterium]|nr:hypothetical protein [Candidatus Acidoferrales bacterium]